MPDYNSILARALSDPGLSYQQKQEIQRRVREKASVTPSVPVVLPDGAIPTGGSFRTPTGTTNYSFPQSDPNKQIQQALGAGNNLASVWEIPERIPDRIVQGQRFDKLADSAGVETMVPTTTERTILGGVKYRPGKLADIENASIIPTALIEPNTGIPVQGLSLEEQQQRVDQFGPDPYGALSFGADIPATMLDRQKFEDYQQVRNQGRAMRDQFQIPMDVIQSEALTIPDNLMTEDFVMGLPNAPAARRNSPIPASFYTNPTASQPKALSKEAVQWAVEQVGSKDPAAVREFLKKNGFDLE